MTVRKGFKSSISYLAGSKLFRGSRLYCWNGGSIDSTVSKGFKSSINYLAGSKLFRGLLLYCWNGGSIDSTVSKGFKSNISYLAGAKLFRGLLLYCWNGRSRPIGNTVSRGLGSITYTQRHTDITRKSVLSK